MQSHAYYPREKELQKVLLEVTTRAPQKHIDTGPTSDQMLDQFPSSALDSWMLLAMQYTDKS